MEAVTRNKYNVVNIVGGGIKDKMICHLTAKAITRVVSAGPEATLIGNIMVQAFNIGNPAIQQITLPLV